MRTIKPLSLLLFVSLVTSGVFGQPANDDFTDAVDISLLAIDCSSTEQFNNLNSTLDGPVPSVYTSLGNNVWFKFQAQSSNAVIDLQIGTLSSYRFALFDADQNEIDATRFNLGYELSSNNLIVGDWYYLSVGGTEGTFGFCINEGASNDFRDDALELTSLNPDCNSTNQFNNFNSSTDGPAPSVYPNLGNNIWFKFQAQSSNIVIDLNLGSLGSYRLALFDASENEIDATCFNHGYELSSNNLVVGDWYYLSVGGTEGTFGLCMNEGIANDFLEDALELTSFNPDCNSTDQFNNFNSSTDGPVPSVYPNLGKNVWFKFQAQSSNVGINLQTGTLSSYRFALFDADENEIDATRFDQGYELSSNNLTIGDWYYLSVGGTEGTFGFCFDNSVVSNEIELQALRDLYESTNGDDWASQIDADPTNDWPRTNAEWDAVISVDQVVGWNGVTVTGGDITDIVLRNEGLSGSISTSISNLAQLKRLILGEASSNNDLTGVIPTTLGDLKNLETLVLAGNSLTGEIPNEIFDINTLVDLVLSQNNLTGAIPDFFDQVPNLEQLTLAQNQLSGNLPSSLASHQNIRTIYLESNSLEGELPDYLGALPELRYLNLTANNFSGSIPESLGDSPKLNTIYLSQNEFSGLIPASLGNLSQLKTLHLKANKLRGQIPDSFINLTALNGIHLDRNQITGPFPEYFVGFPDLIQIKIFSNNFTSFPDFKNSVSLPNISLVQIHANYIPQSDIDANMPNGVSIFPSFTYSPQKTLNGLAQDEIEIQALRDLYESTGGENWTSQTDADPANDWPASTSEWDAITSIDQLTGWHGITIASGDITEIRMRSNNLVGPLPSSIQGLAELRHLDLEDNSLNGEMPSSLANLLELRYLRISKNQFTGNIPDLSSLTELQSLFLGFNNDFDPGPLPEWVGAFSNLAYLHFQSMNRTGSIPESYSSLTNLVQLFLNANELSGQVPTWIGNIDRLTHLSLAYNSFTGRIPDEWQGLTNLQVFNLTGNDLEGTIPAWIGEFSSLFLIALESSGLEGEIPESIAGLNNLSRLLINGNNFTKLPDFSTHPNSGSLDLTVTRNLFTFEDLEPNFNASYASFNYNPQNSPTTVVLTDAYLNEPADILNARAGGANTLYQWQEWNGTDWVDVDGQTTATLSLPTITLEDDSRRFRCEMTNTLIAGMTLYSEEYEVNVIITQTFYAIANGNWSDPAIWSLSAGGESANQIPTQFDRVEIGSHQVQVTGAVDCRQININASNSTLLLVSGEEATLTVAGEVTIFNQSASDINILQVVNGGKLACN